MPAGHLLVTYIPLKFRDDICWNYYFSLCIKNFNSGKNLEIWKSNFEYYKKQQEENMYCKEEKANQTR